MYDDELKKVRKELYRWQAKHKIMSYYQNIPLYKFKKLDLILILNRLINDELIIGE